MSALAFEDVHTFPGNDDFYPVPNESLERWDTLLKGLRVSRIAGICSGGEVGFLSLLPRARRELVLVDHSYKSLYFAIVKYLALRKYGAEETYKRLTELTPEGAQALAAEFEAEIPGPLKAVWEQRLGYTRYRNGADALASRQYEVTAYWKRQAPAKVVKMCAKLDRVRFVHGDLSDLSRFGKFGLVYLSNALESNHRTRDRVCSVPAQVAACLRAGGYVLTTHSEYAGRSRAPADWELVESMAYGDRNAGELRWKYNLYKVSGAAA
jgi:hypothetical protein